MAVVIWSEHDRYLQYGDLRLSGVILTDEGIEFCEPDDPAAVCWFIQTWTERAHGVGGYWLQDDNEEFRNLDEARAELSSHMM